MPAPVEAARPPTSVVVKAAAVTVTPELVIVDDGAGAVARRRPGRGLGPLGRRHASEARSCHDGPRRPASALMRVVPRPRGEHTSREMMPRRACHVTAHPLVLSLRRAPGRARSQDSGTLDSPDSSERAAELALDMMIIR